MADDLAALLKREQKLFSMLDLVEQFIGQYKVEEQYNQLRVRLETLEHVAKEFYELRDKIEQLEEAEQEKKKTSTPPADAVEAGTGGDAEDGVKKEDLTVIDRSFQVMQEFDDRYCALKGDLLFLRDGNPQQPPPVPAPNQVGKIGQGFSKVKLPEIKLPSFSGNIYEWVAFRDTFRSLIHDNPQLTTMDKYTYLWSSLTGAALLEVNSVDFAAQYYDVAWEALEKRYEIKKRT